MTAQPPHDPLDTDLTSGPATGGARLTDLRSRAAVALVLGLVGALGTGALSTGVTSLMWALDDTLFNDPLTQWAVLGGITAAFGAGAWALSLEPSRSGDAVAVPVARAAQVAAVVAVVAGVLTVLAALLDQV